MSSYLLKTLIAMLFMGVCLTSFLSLLKLLVVRVYRQFLKYAPGLGMAIFTLTMVIFLITAGYFYLRGGALE